MPKSIKKKVKPRNFGSKNIPRISDKITYLDEFERDSKNDLAKADRWIIERRKFFIKLAWLVGMVGVLLILSKLFLPF